MQAETKKRPKTKKAAPRRPKLTIGMAHYEDFNGVYFTVHALRMYHDDISEIELVVVDNSAGSADSAMMRAFIEGNGGQGFFDAKYIDFSEVVGTSASRNGIFEHATGDAVLVMDCHVFLMPDAVQRLIQFYDDHPGTNDIYSGPLVYDDLVNVTTHFDDNWRNEMWGTWGAAWQCDCKQSNNGGSTFAMLETAESAAPTAQHFAQPITLTSPWKTVALCEACGKDLPKKILWVNHEAPMQAMGYRRLGHDRDDPPFEIPGHGLGVFSCRREAWLGFNEHAAGFGGEELYIHGKYRAAGHRAMSLPFLQWVHRFGRPQGVKYPIERWGKVRNYVLEFNEMGWPLNAVESHFVQEGRLTQDQWDMLIANPIDLVLMPGTQARLPAVRGEVPAGEKEGCNTCGAVAAQEIDEIKTVEVAYDSIVLVQRDLNEHMPKLRELASNVSHATEFTSRRESSIAFLAGGLKRFVSYQMEKDRLMDHCIKLARKDGTSTLRSEVTSPSISELEPTELLFLDGEHTFDRLTIELAAYADQVSRYIVLHDTHLYGAQGQDGGRGLLEAVTNFTRKNPQWSIIYHTIDQYGLTVLSCSDEDKPELPSMVRMATNFAKATAKYVASGKGMVSKDLHAKRLTICSLCTMRLGDRCTECGCPIVDKAVRAVESCPLGFWPMTDEEGENWLVVPPIAIEGNQSPIIEVPPEDVRQVPPDMKRLESVKVDVVSIAFQRACTEPSDINEHVPVLSALAEQCDHVTEMGVRGGISTIGLIAGNPSLYVGYDINEAPGHLKLLAAEAGVEYSHVVASTLDVEIMATDLLFIDTLHNYAQLKEELTRHAQNVARWIVMHDTETFGKKDEVGVGPGLQQAIDEFLADNNEEWQMVDQVTNNNGLTVLERIED